MSAYTIKVLLHDGTPSGVREAAVSGWDGRAFVIPRNRVSEQVGAGGLFDNLGVDPLGVYVLLGDTPLGEGAYIGEGNLKARLRTHVPEESQVGQLLDWRLCFVISSAELDKADVQYLEAQLHREATEVNSMSLANRSIPAYDRLSRFDRVEADRFLDRIRVLLPILGCRLLEGPVSSPRSDDGRSEESRNNSPRFMHKQQNVDARIEIESDGRLRLLTGSRVFSGTLDDRAGLPKIAVSLRDRLIAEGVFRPDGDHFVTTRDVVVDTANQLGVIVVGNMHGPRTSEVYPEVVF